MEVDIAIVNYNSGNCLQECLQSLDKFDSNYIKSISVVDNCSSDLSNEIDLSLLSDIRSKTYFINENINHGFAKACNIGSRTGNSEFILFLNPDTFLSEDIFSKIAEIPKSKLNTQITGVNLLDETNQNSVSAANFPSFKMLLIKSFGLHKIFPFLDRQLIKFSQDGIYDVDVVSGAFFFISRDAFNNLNGFDERFFVYYEEVDLALRAKNNLDMHCVIDSSFKVNHIGGGCTQASLYALSLNINSKLLYSKKHFKTYQHLLLLSSVFFIEIPIRILTNINQFSNLSSLSRLYLELGNYVK